MRILLSVLAAIAWAVLVLLVWVLATAALRVAFGPGEFQAGFAIVGGLGAAWLWHRRVWAPLVARVGNRPNKSPDAEGAGAG